MIQLIFACTPFLESLLSFLVLWTLWLFFTMSSTDCVPNCNSRGRHCLPGDPLLLFTSIADFLNTTIVEISHNSNHFVIHFLQNWDCHALNLKSVNAAIWVEIFQSQSFLACQSFYPSTLFKRKVFVSYYHYPSLQRHKTLILVETIFIRKYLNYCIV